MAVPGEILKLVDRFDRNIDAYRSGRYNETQVREEFINPFFLALGWDIYNADGCAEAYKDVIHEDAIRIGSATRAPDYCFRIGGTRKFFLEAKKPSVNIKEDIHPAYQLRRYAWSAKLPLSILTDFEEFAVYDCRIKPVKSDKASMGRTFYFTYRDYSDRWDDIAAVFSKRAILEGSFDRYAESTKAKRGTTEVDSAFLQEIERWREILARNIALRNPSLTSRALNFAVQRTIDRIIFLRICEDRGIEDYGKLMALQNGTGSYKRLCELFDRADERYNSGLFHFKTERGRPGDPDRMTPNLVIDDKALKEIVKNLYYPDSPYEFSVLPADILGQVYERFLGKVIRLTTGHRAVVEEKPEVKKAGGVYYTPTYIVDYIVKETVGTLLEGISPRQAEKLRILDPACGSGSFLIGAYQYLLDWHRDQYVNSGPEKWTRGKGPRLFEDRRGDWKLTTAERKRILLTHIFGVDIDPQAVEVTKLSLLLKVLENEDAETINKTMALFNERALPDLGNNIKCGNSLIGPDFYEGRQLSLLDEEEILRLNTFDWQKEFPDIMQKGGFDAVIGNPPYVRQEQLGRFKTYFQEHYAVYNGVADLYAYFIEKGISLLRPGGYFSYIVANKWMRANYGRPLREWLKERKILRIIDFGDLPVFQGATTYPCILITQREHPGESFKALQVASLDFPDLGTYAESRFHTIRQADLNGDGWSLIDERSQALLEKVKKQGIPLGDYVKGKIYYGIKTGLNEAFVIDGATRERLIAEDPASAELIKPFLAGKDIKRYRPLKNNKFLIFTRRGIDIDKYPAIKRHLLTYKERLLPRPKDWKGDKWQGRKPGSYQWYEIQDTIDYYREFEKPKIIYAEIAMSGQFTLDNNGLFGDTTSYIIPLNSLYILGLLNSKLWTYSFSMISSEIRGGFFRWKRQYLSPLPIRTIDFENHADRARHDRMVELVEGMLDLNRRLVDTADPHTKTVLQRQIETRDHEIDRLVYDLYDLTEEEIKIVESTTD